MPKHNYPTDRKPTGPRPTAGRKPDRPKDSQRVTIWLEGWQVERLKGQDKGEIIRQLLVEYFERTNDNGDIHSLD